MTPNEYQAAAIRTQNDYEKVATNVGSIAWADVFERFLKLNHAIVGLTGEVGELAGALEKHAYYGQPLDKVNICEEIGDCLWYLALACSAVGADMEAIMQANIAKLRARYPDTYCDERAAERNRNRENERKVLGA